MVYNEVYNSRYFILNCIPVDIHNIFIDSDLVQILLQPVGQFIILFRIGNVSTLQTYEYLA